MCHEKEVAHLLGVGEHRSVHFAALERADQLGERLRVLRQRPAVSGNLDHLGAARRERAVELGVHRAVALHDDARIAQLQVLDRGQDLVRRKGIGGGPVDAYAARTQCRGGLGAARRHRGAFQQLQKRRGDAQAIGGAEQRARAHAGLEHHQLRRPLFHGLDERGDFRRVQIGQLGERRRVERHAAALRDELGKLFAEPRLQHGDALAFHFAMRVLARASRSETLRTSARVSCSCAPRLILSSASGTNSASSSSVCDSTVAWRASPPAM